MIGGDNMQLNNKIIGQRIYDNRKKKKMSRKLLGEKINLHETTIKKYEDGEIKNLNIEKLKDFAKILEVSIEEILGINNDFQRNTNYNFYENFESDKSFTEPLGINVDAFNNLSSKEKDNFKVLLAEYNDPITLKYNYYIDNYDLFDQKTFTEFYEYINDYYNHLIDCLIESKYNKLKNIYFNLKKKSESQEKMISLLKEQLELSDKQNELLEKMLLDVLPKDSQIYELLSKNKE